MTGVVVVCSVLGFSREETERAGEVSGSSSELHITNTAAPPRVHTFLKVETQKNRVALAVLGILDYLKTIPPKPGTY